MSIMSSVRWRDFVFIGVVSIARCSKTISITKQVYLTEFTLVLCWIRRSKQPWFYHVTHIHVSTYKVIIKQTDGGFVCLKNCNCNLQLVKTQWCVSSDTSEWSTINLVLETFTNRINFLLVKIICCSATEIWRKKLTGDIEIKDYIWWIKIM